MFWQDHQSKAIGETAPNSLNLITEVLSILMYLCLKSKSEDKNASGIVKKLVSQNPKIKQVESKFAIWIIQLFLDLCDSEKVPAQ